MSSSSSCFTSLLATRNYLPILSASSSVKFEKKLFEGGNSSRLPVARHAMKSAGTTLGRMMFHDLRAHIDYSRERTNLVVLLGRGNNTGDGLYAAAAFLSEFSAVFPSSCFAPYVNLVHCFDSLKVWDDGVKEAAQVLEQVSRFHNKKYSTEQFGVMSEEQSSLDTQTVITGPAPFSINNHYVAEESESAIEKIFENVVCRPVANEAICVLDSVFGMQFRPPLRGATKTFIDLCNKSKTKIDDPIRVRCTVDVSSGIGDECDLENAFRSDYTYATGILKLPLILSESSAPQEITGRVRLVDLKFFDPRSIYTTNLEDKEFSIDTFLSDSENFNSKNSMLVVSPSAIQNTNRAPRSCLNDKRSQGSLLIVAGSVGMPGACLMAVRSAIRSGVGLVTVCAPREVCEIGAASCPEAMWVQLPTRVATQEELSNTFNPEYNRGFDLRSMSQFESDSFLARIDALIKTGKYDALLVGPGLGRSQGTQNAIVDLIKAVVFEKDQGASYYVQDHSFGALVIDADALQPEVMRILAATNHPDNARRKRNTNIHVVLTPHGGELKRCLTGVVQQGNNNKNTSTTTLAASGLQLSAGTHGSIVVEKGPRTWIQFSSPSSSERQQEQEESVSVLLPSGGPVLARGGSGDVLAGCIAGSICTTVAQEKRKKQQQQQQQQQLSTSNNSGMFVDSVVRAALRHGLAADEVAREKGEESVATTDLLEKP